MKVLEEVTPDWKYRRFKTECIKCGVIKDKYMNALFRHKTGCSCTFKRRRKGVSMYTFEQKRLYVVFSMIKQRCNNSKYPQYYLYGGRGIKCEWVTFIDFWNDMGESYKKGLSIDRIDNNCNYNKENCRWADIYTQNNNRRNNIFVLPWVTLCNWMRENWIQECFFSTAAKYWKMWKSLSYIKQKYIRYEQNKKARQFRKQNGLTYYEYNRYHKIFL